MKSRNLWKWNTDILHLQTYSTKALASESDTKGNGCSFVLLFIPHQCAQTVEVVGAAFLIRLLLSAKIIEAYRSQHHEICITCIQIKWVAKASPNPFESETQAMQGETVESLDKVGESLESF